MAEQVWFWNFFVCGKGFSIILVIIPLAPNRFSLVHQPAVFLPYFTIETFHQIVFFTKKIAKVVTSCDEVFGIICPRLLVAGTNFSAVDRAGIRQATGIQNADIHRKRIPP